MATTLYQYKQMEGYLLSAGNLAEAGVWCGGTVDAVAGTITLDHEDGLFSVAVGEYIIKDQNGQFHVYEPADFTPFFQINQIAAIGLDAKTDTQKITDIIAALRSLGLLGPNA